MRFTWIGGPSFVFEVGSFRLVGDPVLGTSDPLFTLPLPSGGEQVGRRLTPLPEMDLGRPDAVVITAVRPDHVDAAAAARLQGMGPVVVPLGGVDAAGALGFGERRGLAWNASHIVEKAGERLKITAIAAGGPGVGPPDAPLGCGYLFEHVHSGGGYAAYWTGDTRWSTAVRDLKATLDRLDLLVIHLGAEGRDTPEGESSLNAKDAMQFVFMLQPKRLIPIHHTTFSHYCESVDAFKERVDLTMYDRRLVILDEGADFEHDRGGSS